MKKSFLDNPALRFISTADPEPELQPEPERPPAGLEQPPKGYKIDFRYTEKKTKRVQIVLQPSTFSRLKKVAAKGKVSINEYINRAILEKLEREE
jgi:hypothetical protein